MAIVRRTNLCRLSSVALLGIAIIYRQETEGQSVIDERQIKDADGQTVRRMRVHEKKEKETIRIVLGERFSRERVFLFWSHYTECLDMI